MRTDGAASGAVDDGRPRYRVRLDVFEGPFDLLLRLIAARRLDVSDVDLAEITADFLAHLRVDDADGGITALDLETATHFLVVAATLIELKAARLVPAEERDEVDDLLAEAHDVLYARLLEYRAFREVSGLLRDLLDANAGHLPREVALERHFQGLAPEVELDVEATTLAGIAATALAPRPDPTVDTTHIRRDALSVRDAAARILRAVRGPGLEMTYRSVVAGLDRVERVVHFLALLELYKLGHVDLAQPDFAGALRLRRTAGGGDLAALEHDGAPEDRSER